MQSVAYRALVHVCLLWIKNIKSMNTIFLRKRMEGTHADILHARCDRVGISAWELWHNPHVGPGGGCMQCHNLLCRGSERIFTLYPATYGALIYYCRMQDVTRKFIFIQTIMILKSTQKKSKNWWFFDTNWFWIWNSRCKSSLDLDSAEFALYEGQAHATVHED